MSDFLDNFVVFTIFATRMEKKILKKIYILTDRPYLESLSARKTGFLLFIFFK